ncbi:hypothetical protein ACIGNX_34580, partial [Actinosynnema sp. NPDC053489]
IGVRGLLNVQYALKDDVLYVLEANPRASRTVPFVSKATNVQLAKAAARIMLGTTIAELRADGALPERDGSTLTGAPVAIKEAVLPFHRFRTPEGLGVDPLLGPEMKSTGEVMGIDATFGAAFAKSQLAAGVALPASGKVYVSFTEAQAAVALPVLDALREHGLEPVTWAEQSEVDTRRELEDGVVLVVTLDRTPYSRVVRAAATHLSVPVVTTAPGLRALVAALAAVTSTEFTTTSLQRVHEQGRTGAGATADGGGEARRSGYDLVPLGRPAPLAALPGA